jgi:hypothetical protein
VDGVPDVAAGEAIEGRCGDGLLVEQPASVAIARSKATTVPVSRIGNRPAGASWRITIHEIGFSMVSLRNSAAFLAASIGRRDLGGHGGDPKPLESA